MGASIAIGRREDAFLVRRAVFMDEQGYTNEFDALDDDPACIHLTLALDGELAGCARTYPVSARLRAASEDPLPPHSLFDEGLDDDEVWLLGRVAVLPAFRRRGLASMIVAAADEVAREAGARLMKLHAQTYAQGLYAGQGYEAIGEVDYEDEGQPHRWMAKLL